MKLKLPGTGLFALVLLLLAGVAQAEVQLPRLFSDGAVLQRDQPLRIWGTADAGAPVHVDLPDQAEHTGRLVRVRVTQAKKHSLMAQRLGEPW